MKSNHALVFPEDIVKKSVKWKKYSDFMDNTPKYSFEGRDPENTLERFAVVIYTEIEPEYAHDIKSERNFYYGYVVDRDKERSDTVGRFKYLNEAKRETLNLFNDYMTLYLEENDE